MAAQQTSVQKLTDLRIQRNLGKRGAIGMKGFLLWTEAAWPKAISQKILKAASAYTPGAGITPGQVTPALASPAAQGFGFFGDTSSYVWGSLPADDASTDPTSPIVSATTNATPAQPATPSWLSDVGNAITAATTAYLGVTQVQDAQSIFQTNLARAQQGLPPIPTNPTQYGLPAPTVNFAPTPTFGKALLIAGLFAGGLVLSKAIGGHRR